MSLPLLPQSDGFRIVAALVAAIGADPVLGTLPLVRNPRRPQHLAVGERVVIMAERSDSLIDKSGTREKRRRTVTIGALVRTAADADAQADGLYQLLSDKVQAALKLMVQAGEVGPLMERDVQFHVDDLEVDGAIVVGGWEVTYWRNRPRA